MKILLSPQVNENKFEYKFGNDVVTARFNDKTDTFDFSEMPNGIIEEPWNDIETDLDINPILSVERVDGELRIELLNFIGADATEKERFPEWFEVKDDGKD